ncbi:helix-turn-helix domain-containing protein [Agromyces seonyuensis]|uniref:Helix-turn-helix domain-containing protein n=1 Tax=Agromyces seonyuensis TaxID=2662446 RepID=A0A6I4P2V0_9MICO|nr:XRE family transcriptional regulator [Agromyces seonyuensis]MWB97607.1 helix-turn-helix domain-containing protein [Agromyces seonyuensis]
MHAGPEVGSRLRRLRVERALSLSELARRAGIGKGTLSELERGLRNPTIDTLYALCEPLGAPITALVGDTSGTVVDDPAGGRAIQLDVRQGADGTVVEVFRLEFPAGAGHDSPRHGDDVREDLVVTAGRLAVGPVGAAVELGTGEHHAWTSDAPHVYRAVDGPAEAIVIIRTPPARAS